MFLHKSKLSLVVFLLLVAIIMTSCGKTVEPDHESLSSLLLYMQCGNVRTLNMETGEIHLVVEDSQKINAVAWSPSGEKILYRDRYVGDGTGGLWISEYDGSNLQQVFSMTEYPEMKIFRAFWLTDNIISITMIDSQNLFSYKLELDTLSLVNISQSARVDFASPDGDFWIQSYIRDGERIVEIASFTEVHDSITGINYSFYQNKLTAAYSPDGKKLVYIADKSVTDNNGDLWIINVDEKGFSAPRFFADTDYTTEYNWSPDGKVLGVLKGNVFILLDGETGALLKELQVKSRMARFWWSPDSKSIITNDITDIWELDIETGESKSILNEENSVPGCVGDPVDWRLIPVQ